jgi:hypothetical protein
MKETTSSRWESSMTAEARKTIARFGGATMLALVVGVGAGVGGAIATTAMTQASTVPPATAPAGPAANGSTGNHAGSVVTLAGCIDGLNC